MGYRVKRKISEPGKQSRGMHGGEKEKKGACRHSLNAAVL